MITNNAAFAERVSQAGQATGELAWELPLLPEYRQAVKSRIADIKNTAGRPAGSITAGRFLSISSTAGRGYTSTLPAPRGSTSRPGPKTNPGRTTLPAR